MDRDELRQRQRPLKERYREDANSAVVVLSAEGSVADSDVACSLEVHGQLVEAGLHPATGGDGTQACSGDMLLESLVACAGVTLRSVATSRGLEVSGRVRAEGELDFRGTLGIDPSAPVGFRSITLSFELTAPGATPEQLDELIETTRRYCVVYQTLASPPALDIVRS